MTTTATSSRILKVNGLDRADAVALAALLLIGTASVVAFAPHWTRQHWDSLNYAYGAETAGFSAIWGNHPLGHILLISIYKIVTKIGYSGKALGIFIISN